MRRFYPKPEYRQMTDLDFLIDEENRKRNLVSLEKLLTEITKKWPDVEFMTTPELGKEIAEKG